MCTNEFQERTRTKSCNFRRFEVERMRKMVSFVALCLFTVTCLGCESFILKKNNPGVTNTSAEKNVSSLKSSGYLSNGSTVTLDTGEENKNTSLLEQFDQLRKDFALSLGTNVSLEKELENEKTIKVSLESELEEFRKQVEITQQLIIENERTCKKLEESQTPYEKKIRELKSELTKAQIEATKAKQELIGLKITQLVERKKQKSPMKQ